MNRKRSALALFTAWFDSLSTHKSVGGPARGTMAAALNVLERLKDDYNLSLDSHRAAGRSQIKGASGASLKKILLRFGETRPFLKEGGRTNRGAPGDIGAMLASLKGAHLETLNHEKRIEILNDLQAFLVNKVREYHNRQRIRIEYDSAKTTWQTIRHLLTVAKESGKEGP
ncbi:MAG: DUF4928 family protein, partial [Desulfomonile tiedjei]|nr:DUF4928 family protein [Desulfomonile tiedjei]